MHVVKKAAAVRERSGGREEERNTLLNLDANPSPPATLPLSFPLLFVFSFPPWAITASGGGGGILLLLFIFGVFAVATRFFHGGGGGGGKEKECEHTCS